METISLLSFLGFFSIEDIRTRGIHMILLGLSAIVGLLFHLFNGRISIWSLLGGLGIGLLLFGISTASHEKIGKGDALLLSVTGIFLGFWNNLFLLWISSVVSAVISLIAVILFHKGREYELPFIPCVFLGYIILLMTNGFSVK